MDVVISKSERSDKNMKAVIDGKKQFILVHLDTKILQLIRIQTENSVILLGTRKTKILE